MMRTKILWIIFCALVFQDTTHSLFFKYGPFAGDYTLYDEDYECFDLPGYVDPEGSVFTFLGTTYNPNQPSVCVNGLIMLDDEDEYDTPYYRGPFPNATEYPGIGVLFQDWEAYEEEAVIFGRLEKSENALTDIDGAIRAIESDYGSTSIALIATWVNVNSEYDDSITAQFQAVLATDDVYTFLIKNYKSLNNVNGTYTAVGFGNGNNQPEFYDHPYSFSEDVLNLLDHSNVREPGRWIYRVDSADTSVYPNDRAITSGTPSDDIEYEESPDLFFKYGLAVGDRYEKGDSGSLEFDTSNFTVFGADYFISYMHIDGSMNFGGSDSGSNRLPDFDYPTITAFADDHDNEEEIGMLYGRYTVDETDLDDIDDVLVGNVPYTRSKHALIASWIKNPQYNYEYSSTLTYQLAVATDGYSTYAILHYYEFTNYSLTYSEELAVGFDAGDDVNFWEHPYGYDQYENLLTESNAGVPGRWIYEISEALRTGHPPLEYAHRTDEGELEVEFTITNMAFDSDLEDQHTDTYKELYWDLTEIILDAVNVENAVVKSMAFTGNARVHVSCVLSNVDDIGALEPWVEIVLKHAVDSGDFGSYDIDRDSIDADPEDNAGTNLAVNVYLLFAAYLWSIWKRAA